MAPGKRVSPQDTARIRSYLEDTDAPLSVGAIAGLMGLSKRTIERLKLNFELFDAPYPPPSAKVGRPPILTEDQQGFVLEFFMQNPHAHLADATAAVWERFDVNLSARSVSNILFKHRWTRVGKFKGDSMRGPGTGPGRNSAGRTGTGGRRRQTGSPRQPLATQATDETPVPDRQLTAIEAFNEPPENMRRPAPAPLRDSSSASPPVMLPEIDLPAFALQSGGSPTPGYMLAAMSAPRERVPCPTCGCSSREHQNV